MSNQQVKLFDRQLTALAFLRDYWENSKKMDPTHLAELIKDDFGMHPRVQARSTIDQLVVKGLTKKLNTSTSDQCKVSFYSHTKNIVTTVFSLCKKSKNGKKYLLISPLA